MAEILVHKIEFLKNNPFGQFVAGDVLEVYIETDDVVTNPYPLVQEGTGVVPYLNGSPLASTFNIIATSPDFVAIQKFNPQICKDTSLVSIDFYPLYPYAAYYTQADHYACVVNSPTCDLLLVGTPVVTPASSATAEDGQISLTVTSSNDIEYNLGDDFTYGNGQGSATFENLLAGKYRIFVRDSKNCALNVLVEVPVSNSYGVKYRLEFTDFAGIANRVEILRRGYTGDIIEVCGGDIPFEVSLRGEGSLDKFEPILATSCTLRLVDEVTNQEFIELYTNDANLYRISWSKGDGFPQVWLGKVMPFIYSEEYKSPPYYVDVTGTDGLPELKEFYFVNRDGSRFTGVMSLISIIAFCLKKIGFDLNINVAANLYADGMQTTANDDPLAQATVDVQCFYLAEENPTLEFVLRSILEPFGAHIIQWDNTWNIVRVEEMGTSYDYRTFDIDGNYLSNGTFNPLVDIEYPSANGVMFVSHPNLELNHGYGTVKARYKLGLKPNLLDNGDFAITLKFLPASNTYQPVLNTEGWQLINADYTLYSDYDILDGFNAAWKLSSDDTIFISQSAGDAYIQSKDYNVKMGTNNTLKIKIRYKIGRTTPSFLLPYGITFPYVKVRIMVRYGDLYLTTSGAWSDTLNTVDFLATVLNEYLEGEVTAQQPTTGTPATGMTFNIRVYHATPFFAQVRSLSALRATATYDHATDTMLKPTGYKIELRDNYTLSPSNYMYYYELEENTKPEAEYNLVRPNDYSVTIRPAPNETQLRNPRQWVLKHRRALPHTDLLEKITFFLDKVQMQFLTDGKEPIDAIVRTGQGEKNNKKEYEKDLIIGSSGDLIVTNATSFFDLGALQPLFLFNDTGSSAGAIQPINILSSELLYTGWLRIAESSNTADIWTRDGVSEADKLHGIWIKMVGFQYKKSWRLLRATLISQTQAFSLLSCYREVNDGNRRYIPISGTYNALANTFNGELHELRWIGVDNEDGGSDGSGNSPFTSAFTTGFGGGYN